MPTTMVGIFDTLLIAPPKRIMSMLLVFYYMAYDYRNYMAGYFIA
jgi:hypothetical protein